MSFANYLKMDTTRLFVSPFSKREEANKKFNRKNDKIFNEPRNLRSRKSNGKNTPYSIPGYENIEKEFARRIESRKMVLIEFTDKAADIYSTKLNELLRKQDTEMEDIKKSFFRDIKSEVGKWQKCLNSVRREERKLMNLLQRLKQLYNSPEFQNRKLRKLADMHAAFFQKYEELIKKHNSEITLLKKAVNEEVNGVKRNLTQEFWKKEANLKKNSINAGCKTVF